MVSREAATTLAVRKAWAVEARLAWKPSEICSVNRSNLASSVDSAANNKTVKITSEAATAMPPITKGSTLTRASEPRLLKRETGRISDGRGSARNDTAII